MPEGTVVEEWAELVKWNNKELVDWINENCKDWAGQVAFTVLSHIAETYPETREVLGYESLGRV